LKSEKEKREREGALIRQKKLERENEERETKAMYKEDFNVSRIIDLVNAAQENVESDGEEQSFDNDF